MAENILKYLKSKTDQLMLNEVRKVHLVMPMDTLSSL